MSDQGPPQEGLDPKLSLLPDLAPAEGREDATEPLVSAPPPPASGTVADGEQPPQEGRDPKLLACVNDGGDSPKEDQGAVAAPPSPNKANVAAAMLSIQDSSPPPEATATDESKEQGDGLEKASPKAKKNPNLTSADKLAEWNRIHQAPATSYNFYKNSQKAKRAAERAAEREEEESNLKHLIASAKARPAGGPPTEGTASDLKPLFTLDSAGAASVPGQPNAKTPALLPPAQPHPRTNSNFWLQEEEERFLKGLRLFGWGQWKRIQTVVQTRTNKQIKSHAQKREKVNPDIKVTYSKGKSRRGRISSKVLAADAQQMAGAGRTADDAAGALVENDTTMPSLAQAWKDVYGTNVGDGPNSRARRHRNRAAGKAPPVQTTDAIVAVESSQQLALLELGRQPAAAENLAAPMYKPPGAMGGHAYHPPPPPPAYAHHPAAPTAPPAFAPPPPLPNAAAAQQGDPAGGSPTKTNDTASLRPGMQVYSRRGNTWSVGTIYSAKVDPGKLSKGSSSVALVYHVQFEDGDEDPGVPEENVMSKEFYEEALKDIERYHALAGTHTHPIAGGTPIYCQWMDSTNPEMHGRWMPATIHSVKQLDTGTASYHILFDNEEERHDVPQQRVLERAEYDELVKSKFFQNTHDQGGPTRPITELYSLFCKKNNNKGDTKGGEDGQLDLLSAASQMRNEGSAKREAPTDVQQNGAKRQAI